MFIDKFACFEEDKSASRFCDANLHKIFESHTDEQLCPKFLLFRCGHTQVYTSGLYALMPHQIRQQSHVVVFFNEMPLHSLVFAVRPCEIPSKNFQNFLVRPKIMDIT